MDGKPTLVSLARELGVSRQTVSNAINAPHRVNAATLERVLAAIEASGDRPHIAGRQLRTGNSYDVAMRLRPATDGISGAVLDRFLHALTEAGQRHGYRLTLFTASDDEGEISAIDQLLTTADVDGFVLTSTHHGDVRTAWLEKHGVPFVAFGRPWSSEVDPFEASHCWVDVDGGVGTAAATTALLGQGHRRVGFIGWPEGSGVGDDRRSGWRRALEAAGDDGGTEDLAVAGDDTVATGAQGARELLDRGATAVVCASDSLAIGAAAAWRDERPDDLGPLPVVGFDDTPVAAAVGLSSVRQPIEEVAKQVFLLLMRQLADNSQPPEHVLLPSTLVLREPHPELSARRDAGAGSSRDRQPRPNHPDTQGVST